MIVIPLGDQLFLIPVFEPGTEKNYAAIGYQNFHWTPTKCQGKITSLEKFTDFRRSGFETKGLEFGTRPAKLKKETRISKKGRNKSFEIHNNRTFFY